MIPLLVAAFTYIQTPVTEMYIKPDCNSSIVSQARYGEEVTVLEQHELWSKIQTSDQYQGWALSSALRISETPYPGKDAQKAKVNTFWTYLYKTAAVTQGPPQIKLPFEVVVEVLPTDSPRWIQVRLLDDSILWGQKDDYRFDFDPLSLEEMISLSYEFINLPYFWGGTSSFGYDCSGFMQMLYRQMGITLPRDSSEQANAGGFSAELEPGNLIFFDCDLKTPRKPDHVGLYLGNGQFIHAVTTFPNHPKVIQISSLTDPWWIERFLFSRKIKTQVSTYSALSVHSSRSDTSFAMKGNSKELADSQNDVDE